MVETRKQLEHHQVYYIVVWHWVLNLIMITQCAGLNQAMVAYISATAAFITFLVIFTYHTCAFVLNKPFQKFKYRYKKRRACNVSPEIIKSDNTDLEKDDQEELASVTVIDVNAIKENFVEETETNDDNLSDELVSVTETNTTPEPILKGNQVQVHKDDDNLIQGDESTPLLSRD